MPIIHKVNIDGRECVPAPVPAHLNEEQWAALELAERPIYTYPGCNAWTDVMGRTDDDGFVARLWENAEMNMDGGGDFEDSKGVRLPYRVRNSRVARRVARCLALLAFGEEILLK